MNAKAEGNGLYFCNAWYGTGSDAEHAGNYWGVSAHEALVYAAKGTALDDGPENRELVFEVYYEAGDEAEAILSGGGIL